MSRKTSKERREEKARRDKALQAEIAIAIKTKPLTTGSAKDPAYLFTSLCPDHKRRKAKFFPLLKRNATSGSDNAIPNLGMERQG